MSASADAIPLLEYKVSQHEKHLDALRVHGHGVNQSLTKLLDNVRVIQNINDRTFETLTGALLRVRDLEVRMAEIVTEMKVKDSFDVVIEKKHDRILKNLPYYLLIAAISVCVGKAIDLHTLIPLVSLFTQG